MKKKRNGVLKRGQWLLECAAFLAVERFLALFPLTGLWKAGAAVSGIARVFASRWPTVRNNLRTVLGSETSEAEIQSLTREVFRHTAANLLTALKGAHMPLEEIRSVLEIENSEAAERAHAQGKGALFVIAHMGNWEILAQAMAAFRPEIKIGNIYRPLNNIYLEKILRERREKNGLRMFAKLTSFHAPIRWVERGNILAVLVDQRAGRAGALTPFFGRLMSMSPLPEFIHKRTGAPVIGISMRTSAPGRWTLRFHEPTLHDNETFTTPHLASLLEDVIRESIVDEFWMQNLWRVNERRPLELRGKRGPVRLQRDRDKPLVPFSVLVRIPDQPAPFQETIPALTALAASRPDLEVHLLAREAIRASATAASFPHTFHALEDDSIPAPVVARLQAGLVLTGHERSARELTRLYSGPIYSRPETAQSRHTWHLIPVDQSLPPEERWLQFLRELGMHDPPLQWEYV